jgi:hypothetical protein
MPEANDRNESEPKKSMDMSKLGRDLRGAGRKMLSAKRQSSRSSSPMLPPIGSKLPNVNASWTTPYGLEELQASSSSSPDTESASWGRSKEREQGVTLIIHYTTFGTSEQAVATSAEIVHHMQMRGANVVSALHSDQANNNVEVSED